MITARVVPPFPSPYFKGKRSIASSHICLCSSPRGPCGSVSASKSPRAETTLVEAAHSCPGAALLPASSCVAGGGSVPPHRDRFPHSFHGRLAHSGFEDCDLQQPGRSCPPLCPRAQCRPWWEERSPPSSRHGAMMTFQET